MKNTAKFKNITDQTLTVIGVGIVEPGETVEAPDDFHNVNFQRVTRTKEIKEVKDKEIKTNQNKDL
jgi:hypothetical protein